MDFRQLEAYINVYELKSFSKAAEKMYLSQPSISAYISSLEKELHTQFIYRSTKEFILTKAGISFYQHAKDMLSLRDNAVQSIKDISDANVGSIDIMASSVPAQYILPEILGAFHKKYPDILFNIRQKDSIETVNAISSYEGEVGFVGARVENGNCVYHEFLSERLILITPYEKKFSNINAENIADLIYGEYFVMREAGSGTRVRYEEYMKNIGIDPDRLKISTQLNNTQSIIHAVANGLGISIVSEIAAKHYVNEKRILSIEIQSEAARKFYIVTNKNRVQTPLVENFVKFIHTYKL